MISRDVVVFFNNCGYHSVSSLDIFKQASCWVRFEDVIEYITQPTEALYLRWVGKWEKKKELNFVIPP